IHDRTTLFPTQSVPYIIEGNNY
ncbi:hypothetical protein EZS27_044520, partial [termite gut metagenome]